MPLFYDCNYLKYCKIGTFLSWPLPAIKKNCHLLLSLGYFNILDQSPSWIGHLIYQTSIPVGNLARPEPTARHDTYSPAPAHPGTPSALAALPPARRSGAARARILFSNLDSLFDFSLQLMWMLVSRSKFSTFLPISQSAIVNLVRNLKGPGSLSRFQDSVDRSAKY